MAQLVAQDSDKVEVDGSTPSVPTMFSDPQTIEESWIGFIAQQIREAEDMMFMQDVMRFIPITLTFHLREITLQEFLDL
jgi:hypothetical protein